MSSILILGAGGGYDIWAGFGLGRALAERSLHLVEGPKTEVKSETSPKIHWANYSWTDRLDLLDSKTNSRCTPFAIEIVPDSVPACKKQEEYFPEWALAKQLKQSVWAIRMVPPIVLVHTLTALVKRLNIDTIICIDAGSDALLFGDERKHERGSPTEEMTVLSAVYYLQSHSKIISQASIACISVSTEGKNIFFLTSLSFLFRNTLVEFLLSTGQTGCIGWFATHCTFSKGTLPRLPRVVGQCSKVGMFHSERVHFGKS